MRPVLVFLLLLSACSLGPRVKTYPLAREPQGVRAEIRRGRQRFPGELLAVTDTAFLVVNTLSGRLVLVPYGATSEVRFDNLPLNYTVQSGRPPGREVQQQLRLRSRYPTGVSSDLLSRLLAAYHQDSVEVLAPCAPRGC